MKSKLRNPFVTLYREQALDYFHLMGGAGRYQGFQEWHPALLTLGCALEATGKYSFDQLGFIWFRLPKAIVHQCDGLREKLTRSFVEWPQPFEASIENALIGANFLLQELSVGSRGNPLSAKEAALLKSVEFEFDVAYRAIAGDFQADGLEKR